MSFRTLALAGVCLAHALPLAATQDLPQLAYEKFTLPNGLQVILHEDRSVPLVAVNVWYHVGSADELPGRTGFAHLFEHVMFMGSENVPVGQFDVWMESAGGSSNGSTTEDRTNYYEDVPSNALPLALWLEADRMGWLLPTLDQEKLDLQREVVKNERLENFDNRPYGRATETILAALFPSDHPYSWTVIGSMDDLSAASLDDVKAFFRKWYAPNNATLVIAGDFERDETKAWVEKYFGAIPRGPAIERRASVPAPRIQRDTFLLLEDRVQLPRVYYAWGSPKAFAPGDAEFDLIRQILVGGKDSRLYKRLVYDLQIAADVSGFQSGQRLDGIFQLQFTAKPGHEPTELAAVVDEEIARLVAGGVTDRELEAARNGYMARLLDRMSSVNGKSEELAYYDYFLGEPNSLRADADRYLRAKPADLQNLARVLFARPKVVLTVVPEGDTSLLVPGGRR